MSKQTGRWIIAIVVVMIMVMAIDWFFRLHHT
jgi:hypothetical protein